MDASAVKECDWTGVLKPGNVPFHNPGPHTPPASATAPDSEGRTQFPRRSGPGEASRDRRPELHKDGRHARPIPFRPAISKTYQRAARGTAWPLHGGAHSSGPGTAI